MSKRTIGLVAAGAALASAAALSVAVTTGHNSAEHDAALTSSSAPAGGSAGTDGTAGDPVQLVNSTSGGQAPAGSPAVSGRTSGGVSAQVAAPKAVGSVTLSFPTLANKVGANVVGSILVVDTAGKTRTAVEGAAVAFQQKRGNAFVTVADGVTDDSGQMAVSFTSAVNTTWRAQLTPVTGAKKYSRNVVTIASASVTWAARPDLEVTHGVATSYSFRVDPAAHAPGPLEIAHRAPPPKWTAVKHVAAAGRQLVLGGKRPSLLPGVRVVFRCRAVYFSRASADRVIAESDCSVTYSHSR